jgi:hypothetical protein
MVVLNLSWLVLRSRRLANTFTLLGRESLMILVFHLLGMQIMSAAVVYGLHETPQHMAPQLWWACASFGIAFSLVVAAAVKRLPLLRWIYYGRTSSSSTHRSATAAVR